MDAEQYLRDKLAANHLGTADVVLVAAPTRDAPPPAEGPWVVLSVGAHRYAVGAISRGQFRTYDTADTVEAAVDLAVHLAATPLSIEVTAYTEDQLTSRGSAVAQAIARRAAERGGQPGPSQVRPGDMLDVVGPATGHHLYPLGTPFPHRSQPPTDVGAEFHRYRVLQPLPEAQEGLAAPWFGQPGGGQHDRARPTHPLVCRQRLPHRDQHPPHRSAQPHRLRAPRTGRQPEAMVEAQAGQRV